jgi:hypothetical protein
MRSLLRSIRAAALALLVGAASAAAQQTGIIEGRITTKPMYLFLEDGIPTRPTGFFNHDALYEVNIPQSGGIEVLKGPVGVQVRGGRLIRHLFLRRGHS